MPDLLHSQWEFAPDASHFSQVSSRHSDFVAREAIACGWSMLLLGEMRARERETAVSRAVTSLVDVERREERGEAIAERAKSGRPQHDILGDN